MPFSAATARAQVADIAERAVKTFAQGLLAYFVVGDTFDVFHADWGGALGVSLGAALVSVLTSVASLPLGVPGTASATAAVAPVSALPLDRSRSASMGPDLHEGP